MPHYKDGTEAQVGDHVVGKPYNTDHEVAGTVVSITPGAESCNLQVEFIESMPLEDGGGVDDVAMCRNAIGERHFGQALSHGTKGTVHKRMVCRDYGEVKAFTLVARPAHGRPLISDHDESNVRHV